MDTLGRFAWRVAFACTVAGAALIAAPIAAAQDQAARLGSVAATLRPGGHGPAVLTIARGGRVAYSGRVTPANARTTVQVLHLEPGREPRVLVQLAGARGGCCTVEEVFTYDAGKRAYIQAEHDFRDSSVALRRLDRSGREAFVTTDPGFSGRFTDAAHSGRPIKVFQVFGGIFGDVTGAYPALIAADAARWLHAYQARAAEQWRDSAGFLAAWAADENQLGNMHSSDAFLGREARAGHIHSARPEAALSGEGFVTTLDKYLYTAGYVPMCGGG